VSKVVEKVAGLLPLLDLSLSPPENALRMYALIAEMTGIADPYLNLRQQSNALAQGLRHSISRRIKKSVDPLKTAIHYAAAANIIDYGTHHKFDAEQILAASLQKDFSIDHGEQLLSCLRKNTGCRVLYLADNSGEIVVDGLLVEELQAIGCRVTLAVRDTPVINDATMEDARTCGIDKLCRVITNGSGCPGTPLASCSAEFLRVFRNSDVVLSKGQGNFETLCEVEGPLYYLMTVKCPVVGRHVAFMGDADAKREIGYGEMVLMKRSG